MGCLPTVLPAFFGSAALMTKGYVSLSQLLRVFIDGVPHELASRLLPASSWLKCGLVGYVHLHAKVQRTYADTQISKSTGNAVARNALIGLIESLHSAVAGLEWKARGTEWGRSLGGSNQIWF